MAAPTFYINLRNAGFDMDMEDVKRLIENWYDFYPEIREYHKLEKDGVVCAKIFEKAAEKTAADDDDGVDELEEAETVSTILYDADNKKIEDANRMIQLFRVTNLVGMTRARGTFCALANFPFQSLAAIGNKIALWWVFYSEWSRCKTTGEEPRYRMVNFIHDEIICEIKNEWVAVCSKEIGDLMVSAAKVVMPDVLIKTESTAMDRWSKTPEPTFNEKGELISVAVTLDI